MEEGRRSVSALYKIIQHHKHYRGYYYYYFYYYYIMSCRANYEPTRSAMQTSICQKRPIFRIPTGCRLTLLTDDEDRMQTGIVQLYQIINGQVDVDQPLMTISGDRELARFGANVHVSSPSSFHATFQLLSN